MLKTVQVLVLVALLPALSGCNLQKKMLYYPNNDLPSRESLQARDLRFWPAPDDFRGFAGPDPAGSHKGTIVVFHGNGGNAPDRTYYVRELAPLGYRVILAEYPGYGGRPGEPGEAVFVEDAQKTIRIASEQYGNPLFVIGESLGSGVAAAAVNRITVPVDGIVIITPWDTLKAVAGEKFPWLPVSLFLRDKYDSIGNLQAFPGRIAVIGAELDQIIPVRHAKHLYESLPQDRKKFWLVKNAGHNDWQHTVDGSWWNDILSSLAEKNP